MKKRAKISRLTHLDHVDEIVEELLVIDGQFVVFKDDSIVENLLTKADAQHKVTGMPNRLPYEEKPVLRGLQFANGLLPGYFAVKPSVKILNNVRAKISSADIN